MLTQAVVAKHVVYRPLKEVKRRNNTVQSSLCNFWGVETCRQCSGVRPVLSRCYARLGPGCRLGRLPPSILRLPSCTACDRQL